jgi:predicted phosphodiesterase
MIIDYISDIHEDTHLNATLNEESFLNTFGEIFPNNPGEVLLIAGDLSHKINRIKTFLTLTKEIYKYKRIFYVIGNHEMFLLLQKELDLYKYNSINKINHLKQELEPLREKGIYLLDGEIIKYKNIRFGGTCGWYDGSFIFKQKKGNLSELMREWYNCMPDGKFIYGIGNILNFFEKEIEKVETIFRDSDIILTHINPISEMFAFSEPFKNSETNAFFAFDGERYVKTSPAKIWLYGHTHIPKEYEHYGTKLLCNPYGYPGENRHKYKKVQIKQITIKEN